MSTGGGAGRRLTAAVAATDDMDGLAATLESVRAVADEVVVADTGLAAGVGPRATACGAKVVDSPWRDDWSEPRNAALAAAGGDWLLWLDAGETLGPEDAAELRRLVDREADPGKAYMLLVLAPPVAGAEAEQAGRVRLTPRVDGLHYRGRIRESLVRSLLDLGLEVEGRPVRIRRPDREAAPEVRRRTAQRTLRLAELALEDEGPQARLLNCLGESLQTLGRLEEAERRYREALRESEAQSSDQLEAYYGLLTCLDGQPDRRDEQLALCLEALDVFPLDAQLLCAMGGYLQTRGRLDLAARAYWTAHQYGQVNPEVWHVGRIREIAAACHSLALQVQRKEAEAVRFLEGAIGQHRDSVRLRRQLLQLYVKLGRVDDALAQGDWLAPAAQRAAWKSGVRGACLAAQGNWIAARAYLSAAYEAGARDPLCLRWLVLTLTALGEQNRAREVAERWRREAPDDVEAAQCLEALAGGSPAAPWRVDPQQTSPGGSPPHRRPAAAKSAGPASQAVRRPKAGK